jgi:CBS domain-containing protein
VVNIRTVSENKGKEIIAVDGNVPVSQAISLMVSKSIGALVIQGGKYPDGIITERDVLRMWNDKEKIQNIPVKNIMSKNLIVTGIDDTLMDAMTVMIRKNIRHLLVMDGTTVAGLLSIRDLVKEQIKNSEAKIRLLEDVLSSEISKEL